MDRLPLPTPDLAAGFYRFENQSRGQRLAIGIILACGVWVLGCVLILAVA